MFRDVGGQRGESRRGVGLVECNLADEVLCVPLRSSSSTQSYLVSPPRKTGASLLSKYTLRQRDQRMIEKYLAKNRHENNNVLEKSTDHTVVFSSLL